MASPSPGLKPVGELKVRFFISYAREDYNIAIAVSNAIQTAAGPAAEVFIDVSSLQFGLSFQDEIRKRLDDTDVLVVINSNIQKSAFGFPGLELGYFIGVMDREKDPDFPRRIVPIYLEKPPDAIAEKEGINIGISRATLNLTIEAYAATLSQIDYNHSAVKFLRDLQELIVNVREKYGAPAIPQDEHQKKLLELVKKMQLAIFSHLKQTQDPESTLKPQLQIILKTSDDALRAGSGQLPDDAVLVPVGNGKPMSIFGLQVVEPTWGDFQQLIKTNKFGDSWIDAITKVVICSMQNQLEVDNSQVIVSYDEKSAYRVILTTGTRYFNGNREFNLYFVECLKRGDFGDRETTVLFKGLELLCRFRSLFFERKSEFSSMSCRLARPEAMKTFAASMERELNLMRRDALETGLDKPEVWAEFVDWDRLLKLSEVWRPLEAKIREALTRIRQSEPGTVATYRESLINALTELETTMRPLNADAIAEMAEKLKMPIS